MSYFYNSTQFWQKIGGFTTNSSVFKTVPQNVKVKFKISLPFLLKFNYFLINTGLGRHFTNIFFLPNSSFLFLL